MKRTFEEDLKAVDENFRSLLKAMGVYHLLDWLETKLTKKDHS